MSQRRGTPKTERRSTKRELKRNPLAYVMPEQTHYVRQAPKEVAKLRPKTLKQAEYLRSFDENIITFGIGCAGTGKSYVAGAYAADMLKAGEIDKIILTRPGVEAGESFGFLPGPQPLDANIVTPSGWCKMGDLVVGDYVIGRNGLPVKILDIFKKGTKPVYKITTTDGTSTEACGDHLWAANTAREIKTASSYIPKNKSRPNWNIVSTTDIMNNIKTPSGKTNYFLPRNLAVEYSGESLPIPPYLLGALLGDGHIGNAISIANIDEELLNRVSSEAELLGCRLTQSSSVLWNIRGDVISNKIARPIIIKDIASGNIIKQYTSIGTAILDLCIPKQTLNDRCNRNALVDGVSYEWGINADTYTNPIKNALHGLGLCGKLSYDKFIPTQYRYASISDRIDLIRGIMDADGTVKKTGEASYTTVSEKMANDIIELVRSLGGRATARKRNRIGNSSILDNGNTITTRVPSYEFTISLPEHINPFYISRKASRWSQKYIHRVGISSVELIGNKEVQCILVDSDDHLYLTDDFIVTHNTIEDKYGPFLEPFMDVLNERLGKSYVQSLIKNGQIIASPLSFMRGTTFKDALVILDEAQNTTPSQMKMFLTRIGENSKMIINGDMDQSDIFRRSGLQDAVDRFDGVTGFAIVEFGIGDIVRHGIIKDILRAYAD